ncbi:hypothetical protein EPO44_14680 [bacterium]|nr:MAG: hypothetical protein EPO44_14680 [bacterium]
MAQKKTPSETVLTSQPQLPGYATVLAEIGQASADETKRLKTIIDAAPLLATKWKQECFPLLAEALKGWSDGEAAAVVRALREGLEANRDLDLSSLNRWIRAHNGDAGAVIDCLSVDPPEEITIIQRFSKAGSQKLVFLANWQIAQREVILKRIIGREAAAKLIPRELQPHPLSMAHPNIIETHLLKNKKGEPFLVERRLPIVLTDLWRSHGVQEAANLLYDMVKALAFLQEKQLVHGDIKPDNIGYEDGDYILLDFGICRPFGAFAEDTTPTGSLRTRAPELLMGEKTHSYASDIWALGATVFNAVAGRFPLFGPGEFPPRVSHPDERAAYERKLADRVQTEWEKYVDLSIVPEPLQELLGKTLTRDPGKRVGAARLVKTCEGELAAFLRGSEGLGRFSPAEELQQLKAYLPEASVLALMPHSQKHDLKELLKRLEAAKGLTQDQEKDIEELTSRLG